MKKLFFLPVFIVAFHFMGSTQTTRFGFTAGAAFANYKTNDDGSDKASSKTGITAGVLADIPVSKHFSFQPAVNFVQKGTKDDQTSGGVTEKATLTINCIEVPLNFLYNATGNTGNFFIGAGPSFAFGISGKLKSVDGSDSETENVKFGNGDDDLIKGFDLGANFITGYCFPNGLFVSVNYNMGFSNLLPGSSGDGTLKSHYFGIKLGWLLNGKEKK
jgi:Outer membrane protein beta-barrel domain